jgi:hypothetical protein
MDDAAQEHRRRLAMSPPVHLSAAFAALLMVVTAPRPLSAQESRSGVDIAVDASRSLGPLKPLRGVNGAPDSTFLSSTGMFGEAPAVNVSAGYRAAHVNLVRTHDSNGAADIDSHSGDLPPLKTPFGPPATAPSKLDLNVIFPRLEADPADPNSYNFEPTDRLIDGIRAIDADVLFRLGRSGMTTAAPPTELEKYGEIIGHIVLHYNKGWAHGRHDAVRYWEVWNEPDLGRIFWTGSAQQYDALYQAAVRAIKAADPKSLVGGPTIALVNESTPYREGFLAYARDHQLPLDFFSWHWYSVDADDPAEFAAIAKNLRALLDQFGFTHTRSFLDEWNYDFRELRSAAPIQVASFVATSLIYMQEAPIDRSALYRADREFDPNGQPRTKLGQALIDIGRFADTPVRLYTSGSDRDGLAVQAARSERGNVVRVLISNYQIPAGKSGPRANGDVMHEGGLFDLKLLPRRSVAYAPARHYTLTIRGLTPGHYRLVTHRLSDSSYSENHREVVVSDAFSTNLDLPAYVVDSLELSRP